MNQFLVRSLKAKSGKDRDFALPLKHAPSRLLVSAQGKEKKAKTGAVGKTVVSLTAEGSDSSDGEQEASPPRKARASVSPKLDMSDLPLPPPPPRDGT